MLRLLRAHPARVRDPTNARLFVLPIFPYLSLVAGECKGETHEQRMLRAVAVLRREPHFARRHGHDHLLVTNTFRLRSFGPWLKPLLANATVAWFEQPAARSGVGVIHKLAFWRCTVVVPYLANPFCTSHRHQAGSAADAGVGRPAGSVFFQGSWNAAKYLRSHLKELQSMPASHILDVPRGCAGSGSNVSNDAGGHDGGGGGCVQARAHGSRSHTAAGMLHHEFCLVPRGDTPSSGRLFGALACRCVPLILSTRLDEHLPYRDVVAYANWTVRVREHGFIADARNSIETTLRLVRPHLPMLRAGMEKAAPELLYDAPESRVAEHMLNEWSARCELGRTRGGSSDPPPETPARTVR